jgi:hypothetical protein
MHMPNCSFCQAKLIQRAYFPAQTEDDTMCILKHIFFTKFCWDFTVSTMLLGNLGTNPGGVLLYLMLIYLSYCNSSIFSSVLQCQDTYG